jgi:hypothetical protein
MWGAVFPKCGDLMWGDVETLASVPKLRHRNMTRFIEYYA